jgi:ribose-phosphate pyrophosphokinase
LGQAKRGGRYAERLGLPIVIVDKERISDTEVEIKAMIGEVEGKDVIIFDDEISRGTSLIATVEVIMKRGAKSVRAASTHGLFCGPAIQLIQDSSIKEVITTNTVDIPTEKRIDKITVLSVAPLFAEAIKRIHLGDSISSLFT